MVRRCSCPHRHRSDDAPVPTFGVGMPVAAASLCDGCAQLHRIGQQITGRRQAMTRRGSVVSENLQAHLCSSLGFRRLHHCQPLRSRRQNRRPAPVGFIEQSLGLRGCETRRPITDHAFRRSWAPRPTCQHERPDLKKSSACPGERKSFQALEREPLSRDR
jgi:hypothetical protein